MLTFGIVISNIFGYATYASDYTRYLPKQTSSKAIFGRVFLGLFLSTVLLQFFGLVTASAVVDVTPQGLINAMTANVGSFAPVALFIAVVSCIPQNVLNDNSGAYSLISAGVRIPRHLSAIISASVAFVLALYVAAQFSNRLENFLLLILYWVFPWAAIVLVDWLVNKEKTSFPLSNGWSVGATILIVVTAATMVLFPATELYTGAIAKLLGGVDLGYYVGFVSAALSYWFVVKRRCARLAE